MNQTTVPNKPLVIEPFWQHIPQIFKYPAKQDNVLTILVLSILGWLTNIMFGFIGLLLSIAVWMATYKFAYGVLAHTARGNLEPRQGYFSAGNDMVSWQQLGLWFVLFGWVTFCFTEFGPVAGYVMSAFVLVTLPIATMALAIEQSVWAALNPATWIDGIGRIGPRYVALLGLLLMFFVTSWTTRALLGEALPLGLGLFAFEFVSKFFLVAMFYLLGYVIYQYHDEFGFELDDFALERTERARGPQPHPALARAEELVVDGKPDQAKAVLRDVLADEGPMSPVAEQYAKLCQLSGDQAGLAKLSHDQLTIALANDGFDQATSLIRRCLDAQPDYKVNDPSKILPLAKHINSRGNSKLALQLCNGFARKYPGHKDLIGNYFLAATILSDKQGRDAEAMKILRALEAKFPNHPQLDQIVQYRQTVEKLV